MNLSEKILKLRTARNMSQGDLAEALDVSRQSVSKWETGQSMPDLDKIIKLADLFEISVDELVREGGPTELPETESKVVYVERERTGLRPVQIIGVLAVVLGGFCVLFGFMGRAEMIYGGLFLIPAGLPLILALKHPVLGCGWVVAFISYLIFNPWTTGFSLKWSLIMLRDGYFQPLDAFAIVRAVFLWVVLFATLFVWKRIRNEKRKDG